MFSIKGFLNYRLRRHTPSIWRGLSGIIKAVSNFYLELRTAQDSRFPEKRAIARRRVAHSKRFELEPEYPRREVEAHLSQYFPLLKPTPDHVVLDFGANEGWFSYALGRLGARVVGFEPNFDAFCIARERCEKMRGVTIVNAAVGPKSGLTELYFPPDYPLAPEIFSGSASTMPSNLEVDTSSGVSVFQIGVEEILDAFPHIYFLKIDIEGGEQELWSSLCANSNKIEFLAIETHERLFSDEDTFVAEAQQFIDEHDLGQRWTLSWP